MSNRYLHTQTTVLLMVIAVGSSAMARQAGKPAALAQAPAPPAQGGVNLNVSQIPTPVAGTPYRFSLCLGRLLNPGEVSAPCRTAQTNAATTVSGAVGNSVVTFRLENGSWLPPGLTLDGFGVISGTTNVDVSQLKVKICAIQLGAIGTNFNCQGKPVGFGKEVAFSNAPPPPPAAAPATTGSSGGGVGGAATMGLLAAGAAAGGYYLLQQQAAVCTEPPQANYHACLTGQSCSTCAAARAEYAPFCDCVEKNPEDELRGRVCRSNTAAIANAERACLAPNASLVPKPEPAVRR